MTGLFSLTTKRQKKLHKFFSAIAIFSLFLQIGSGIFYFKPVLAEDEVVPTEQVTPTPEPTAEPTLEVTPTPTLETTPSPDPTPTIEPTSEISPEVTPTPIPTEEVTPTPTVEENQPTQENSAPPNETGPPAPSSNDTSSATPSENTPTPTITVAVEQPENGQLNAVVLKNVEANSIELDLVTKDIEQSASLVTDKADYAPTDTVLISGSGFNPNETYTLIISSTDEPPVNFETQVTADENGTFVYAYQLDGNYRPNYKVEAKDKDGNIITSTTFTDANSAKNGSTFVNDATVGTIDWTNPSYAQTSNNVYATASLTTDGATTHYLKATNFGFSIPSEATINGIEVRIERKEDGRSDRVNDNIVSLVKNGTIVTGSGSNKASSTAWGQTEKTVVYGNSTDKWASTWTPSDINGSTSGVVLSAICATCGDHSRTASVDQVTMTVYYTEAPGTLTIHKQDQSGNAQSGVTISISGASSDSKTTNVSGDAVFSNIPTGAYTVTETSPTGYHWTSTSGDCTNANPASVTLTTAGKSCTFVNTHNTGSIHFHKTVSGGSAQKSDFTFTISGDNGTAKDNDTKSYNTGSYTLTENNVTGYSITGASGVCSLSGGVVTLNVNTSGGTCTITNTRATGSIHFHKTVVGGSAHKSDFTFTISDGNGTAKDNDTKSYNTGSYTLTENTVAGYSITDASGACSLSGGAVTLDVNTTGGTCTITNTFGPYCGDNQTNGSETCDGNSQVCTMPTNGYVGTQTCNVSCDGWNVCTTTLSCGDGQIDGNETCDDDNNSNGDGCNSSCQIEQGWSCAGQPSVCQVVNPPLGQSCGLDVALVLDNSGSVGSDLGTMKNAFKGFVDALSGTPTQFSVTYFNNTAHVIQTFSADSNTVKDAIDDVPNAGGSTNWQDGLLKAKLTFDPRPGVPDLILFSSDGEPNRYYTNISNEQNPTGLTGPGNGFDQNSHNAAISLANTIKGLGIRIITLGIGGGLDMQSRMVAISSTDAYYNASNFNDLSTALNQIVTDLCGGTVSITKTVDGQTTSGWTFTPNVTDGTVSPTSSVTDGDGKVIFTIDPANVSATVDVAETVQSGYTLSSVSCTKNNQSISPTYDSDSVNGLTVGDNDVVACTFNNTSNYTPTRICHATPSEQNPYVSQTPATIGVLMGHVGPNHQNGEDIIPLIPVFLPLGQNWDTEGQAIWNNDCNIPPTTGTLTVIKHVINDNGGTKVAGDFDITVTSNNPSPATFDGTESPGTTVTLNAGAYSVDEATVGGYTKSLSADCTGTMTSGGSKTCTINNDDNSPALHLRKTVINDNGGTALVTDWTLTATGASGSPTNLSGTTPVDSGVSFKADTYTLAESGGPSGYTASQYSCVKNEGAPVIGNSITLGLGDTATCTINNNDNAPSLTLNKIVVNNNGGTALESAWTLVANGGDAGTLSGPGAAGNTDVVSGPTFKAGTYTLSESGGPAGYTASSWSCIKNGAAPVIVSSITLGLGDSAVCTITNDDIAPKLTLHKDVVNDNGGSAAPNNWTLAAAGSVGSFSGVGPTVGPNNVSAGIEYTLSESGGPTSYTASTWSCTGGGTQAGNKITLGLVDDVTCTITNDDIQPTLTVVKYVINDNGGTKVANNFSITVTGSSPSPASFNGAESPGTVVTLNAGLYSVLETTVTGYDVSYSAECSGDIKTSQNKTCTITNDDIQPKLTVTKIVSSGGTAQVDDFPLFVDGNSVNSGQQIGINVGQHTVSETNQPHYTGVISGDCASDGVITLIPGDVKSCTITNTYQPYCGDGVKNGSEECDGVDGVTANHFCTTNCKLVPIYDGAHSCPAGKVPVKVGGPYEILAIDADGIPVSVTSGKEYLFEATGTFVSSSGGWVSDAGYSSNNNWSSVHPDYGINGNPPNKGAHALLGDFGNGVGIIDWGTYNAGHTYNKYFVPNVSSLQFLIGDRYDSWYQTSWNNQTGMNDNSGYLALNVYECQNYGHLIVQKTTNPSNDLTEFSINTTGSGTIVGGGQGVVTDANDKDYTVTPGTYSVTETVPEGWSMTSDDCQEISVGAGETKYCTFTNQKKAEIWWYKIDKNLAPEESVGGHIVGNGLWDSQVDSLGGPKNTDISTVTAFNNPGTYNNVYVEPGRHSFEEVIQGGWSFAWGRCQDSTNSVPSGWGTNVDIDQDQAGMQQTFGPKAPNYTSDYGLLGTSANTYADVNLTAGQRIYCVFYNENVGSISGYKYEDLDGNGNWDKGEPHATSADFPNGLTIYIDLNLNGQQDPSDPRTDIDTDGHYLFTDLVPGDYSVCERDDLIPGWIRTFPTGGSCQTATVNAGEETVYVNFGNFKLGQITACKYDDYNGNGAKDANEPGMKGITMVLNPGEGQITGETDNNGCYTFSDLGPGIYRVAEVLTDSDLAGYFPTDGYTTEADYRVSGEMTMNSNDSLTVDYFNDLNPVKLELTKSSDKLKLTASPGNLVNFELTVKNTASSSAYGVMVNDVLPIEFNYVNGSGKVEGVAQNPVINGSQLTWSLGTITAGGSKKITYQAIIKSPLEDGGYPNVAVSFGTNRPSGPDNSTSYSNFAYIYTAVGSGKTYSGSVGGGFVIPAVLGAATSQVLGAATGSPTFILIVAILMILAGLVIYFRKGRKFHV